MQVRSSGLVLGLILSLASLSSGASDLDATPALISDTQYSATFDQSRGSWMLIPPGAGVIMQQGFGACRDDRKISPGLWLVTRDAVGRVELVAPSVTPLPLGHPERVTLLACDSTDADGLHLPRALIEALVRDHGAVRIEG